MNLEIAINQIYTLFIIILIGLIAKKKQLINEVAEKYLAKILLSISLPALSISSANINYSSDTLPNMIQIFIITLAGYLVVITFANITTKLFKLKAPLSNVYINLIVFANVAFMGFPIASAFFGSVGILYVTVVNLLFLLFQWTYGLLMFDKKGIIDFKKLLNIGTIAAAITIILFLLNIKLPFALQNALETTGKMTTPISMLMIGSFIADINSIKSFFDWLIMIISFFRLLLIPITLGVMLNLLGINHTVISLCVLMAAMPSASTNAVFAKQFDTEPVFASVAVFVTTLLFLLTLPIVIFVLNNYIF